MNDLVLIVGAGLTAVSVVVFLNPNDVVRRRETRIVQEIVRQADSDAFVVISPSNEVLGEGFKPLTRLPRQRAQPSVPVESP